MRRQAWLGVILLVLCATGWACGGEPVCTEPCAACSPGQLGPAGGWCPYGGGLLHWWPRQCFPCAGAPDDYCRKPLPRVCWPQYPPYYIWGPPEDCSPPGRCGPSSRESH
jgi:hypothetical protein